jgi:hypothetical protein
VVDLLQVVLPLKQVKSSGVVVSPKSILIVHVLNIEGKGNID